MAARKRAVTKRRDRLTHQVRTYVTPDVAGKLDTKLGQLKVKEAEYIRRLIHIDLGIVETT